MRKTKRSFTQSEMAQHLGLSVKALRIYEEKGLVRPDRTTADWRVYGPEQLLQLQQVIALKSFGLPLSRIARLLSGHTADLPGFLALHEAMLRRQRKDVEQAIRLVAAARLKLTEGESLSSNDLIDLARKTNMTNSPERQAAYEAIVSRHLTPADQDVLAANGYAGMDQPDLSWAALITEATDVMGKYPPESAKAMDLAKRWMTLVLKATGGDGQLTRKVRSLAEDVVQQPDLQQQSQSSLAIMDYVSKAYGAAIAAGLMPKPE